MNITGGMEDRRFVRGDNITLHKFWDSFHNLCVAEMVLKRRKKMENKTSRAYQPKICPTCGQPTCSRNYAEEIWRETFGDADNI